MRRTIVVVGVVLAVLLVTSRATVSRAAEAGAGTATATTAGEGLRAEEIAFADIPMVITAAKKLQHLREAPATVDVVTAQDILQWGARTLQEVLRRIPGIVVRNYGVRNEVYIRGIIGIDRVLCLVDGRRINSAFDGSFRGDLPLTNVERIEIIKGPGSSLYGPNAFGGVINIITRKGADVDGVFVSAGGGSDETYTARAAAGFSTDTLDGLVTYGHLQTDGQQLINDNDAYRQDDLFAKLSYAGLTLSGGRYAYDQGIQGRIGRESPNDHVDDIANYADLAYTRDWESAGLNLRGYYEERTNDYLLNKKSLLYEGNMLGGEAQASWTVDRRNFVTVGLDVRRDEAGQDNELFDVTNTGAYLEYETKPVDPLLVTLGGRYDVHSQYEDVFSPRASVVWLPDELTSLRFSYGEAFRAPSIQDLYIDFYLSPTIRMAGNEDLKPEKLRTYELAALRRFGNWLDTSLNFFYTQAEDLILVESSFSKGIVTNSARNVGEATITGFEVAGRGNPLDWLGFFVNYSYQEAEDGDDVRLMYLPYHTINAGVNLTPCAHAGVGVMARYIGERVGMDNTRQVRTDLDSYTVVDLTLRGDWRGFTAEVGVYNLFDREYQETHGYPMNGRSFLATVGYAF